MAKYLVGYLSIALLGLGVGAPTVWADDQDSTEGPKFVNPIVWYQSADAPKNGVGLGWYFIFYHVYASDLSGPFTPAGLGLDVKDTNTLYAAYFRRLSEHFQLELAAGEPPLTKSTGKGPATLGSVPYNGQVITTT